MKRTSLTIATLAATLIMPLAITTGLNQSAFAGGPSTKSADTFKPLPVSLVDVNGDGMLSAKELRAAFREVRQHRRTIRKAKRQKRLAAHDVNGDGKLDKTERMAARSARFAKLDTDGNGSISPTEAKGTRLGKRFTQMDANRDGMLTKAEIAAAHKAFQSERHRGHRWRGKKPGKVK